MSQKRLEYKLNTLSLYLHDTKDQGQFIFSEENDRLTKLVIMFWVMGVLLCVFMANSQFSETIIWVDTLNHLWERDRHLRFSLRRLSRWLRHCLNIVLFLKEIYFNFRTEGPLSDRRPAVKRFQLFHFLSKTTENSNLPHLGKFRFL